MRVPHLADMALAEAEVLEDMAPVHRSGEIGVVHRCLAGTMQVVRLEDTDQEEVPLLVGEEDPEDPERAHPAEDTDQEVVHLGEDMDREQVRLAGGTVREEVHLEVDMAQEAVDLGEDKAQVEQIATTDWAVTALSCSQVDWGTSGAVEGDMARGVVAWRLGEVPSQERQMQPRTVGCIRQAAAEA